MTFDDPGREEVISTQKHHLFPFVTSMLAFNTVYDDAHHVTQEMGNKNLTNKPADSKALHGNIGLNKQKRTHTITP